MRNMEWILARMQAGELPIYTMDIETDPFARGNVPVPFLIGFYDGVTFRKFWSDKKQTCIEKMQQFLIDGNVEPGIIYMHNGGRFDFFFLLEWFEGRTMIIGSRIVQAYMQLSNNKRRPAKEQRFEFRDSYAIMPFPLKAYQKDSLPIEYLTKENRHKHAVEIESYLFGDCFYLWELCMEFQREFGDFKTIASAAFKQLTEFHKYEQLPVSQDKEIRGRFYFGGRVQCFQKGLIEKPVAIYDVNSMYPFVMDTYFHPVSWITTQDNRIHGWKDDGTFTNEKLKTFFLTVEGLNRGAFAVRKKDGSVDFTVERGVFDVTIHEWLVALQLGLFKPSRILNCYSFNDYSRFHLFVDSFYRKREQCKGDFKKHRLDCDLCITTHSFGDVTKDGAGMCSFGSSLHAHNLFYKYILNSAYGKFGLNPENYFNWQITKTEEPPKGNFWELDSLTHEKYYIWKQPNQLSWNVKNIGTAASITGAARSVLLRAIATSTNVLYCDTDSILCESINGNAIDDKKLGAWKLEGLGSCAAIAGKKMYAVFDATGTCIKHATKGVDLKPEDLVRLCKGEEILTERDAPTFKRDGSADFISRTVRMTA